MKRRLLPLLLVGLLLVTGCSSTATTRPQPETGHNTPAPSTGSSFQEIRVVTYENSAQSQMLDVLIAAFQDKYAQYRITKVPVAGGDTFLASVMDYATSGKADVMPMENGSMEKLRQAMQPLEPLIGRSAFDLSPLGPMVDHLKYDGRLMELPYACALSYLVYNKALLEQAGVAVPASGWTWEEFRPIIRRLTVQQGQDTTWGLMGEMYHLLARAYAEEQSGLPLWKADNQAVAAALQYFAGLVLTDKSAPQPVLQDWVKGHSSFQNTFINEVARGKAAIALETWVPPVQLASLFPGVGALPFPTFAGTRPVAVAAPYTFGIPATAANPEGAWQFVRFAVGPDGAAALARAGYQPMYLTDSVREAAVSGGLPGWDVAWSIDHPIDRTSDKSVWRFTEVVNEALSGSVTVEEAHLRYVVGTKLYPR